MPLQNAETRRLQSSPIAVVIAVTALLGIVLGPQFASGQSHLSTVQDPTPVNFKIAFTGDTSMGPAANSVLNLILTEGANMVVHAGDLDYVDNPSAFNNNISNLLRASFPYVYSAGNPRSRTSCVSS